MLPAHQGFHARDLAGAQLDDRVVVEHQLTAVDGASELVDLRRPRTDRVGRRLVPGRPLGSRQQLVRAGGERRRETAADLELHRSPLHEQRTLHCRAECLGPCLRLLDRLDVVEQHGELVTSDASDDVRGPARPLQPVRDRLQEEVACGCAEGAVHAAHAHDVQHEQRYDLVARAVVQRPLGELEEKRAVAQPRERVPVRELAQPHRGHHQPRLGAQHVQLLSGERPRGAVEHRQGADDVVAVHQRLTGISADGACDDQRVAAVDRMARGIRDSDAASGPHHLGAEAQLVGNLGAAGVHADLGRIGLPVRGDDVDHGQRDVAGRSERGDDGVQVRIAEVTVQLEPVDRREPVRVGDAHGGKAYGQLGLATRRPHVRRGGHRCPSFSVTIRGSCMASGI